MPTDVKLSGTCWPGHQVLSLQFLGVGTLGGGNHLDTDGEDSHVCKAAGADLTQFVQPTGRQESGIASIHLCKIAPALGVVSCTLL